MVVNVGIVSDSMSHLVSILEVYENSLLTSWMWRDVSSNDKFWIGLTYETTDTTTFKWVSGWSVSYDNWAVNEPNSDGLIEPSGCSYFGRY